MSRVLKKKTEENTHKIQVTKKKKIYLSGSKKIKKKKTKKFKGGKKKKCVSPGQIYLWFYMQCPINNKILVCIKDKKHP